MTLPLVVSMLFVVYTRPPILHRALRLSLRPRVPTPNNFEMHLEPVGRRLFAALAFNTTALPSEAEFKDACARLARGVPKGYSVVSDGWSPTYVLYSPRNAALWTNECWTQVELKAAGEGAA